MIPLLVQVGEDSERQQYENCLDEHRGSDALLSAKEWCEDLAPHDAATGDD